MEHTKVEHENPKAATSHDDTDHTQRTPPPPKKRYEIMKDPVCLSSPIYPPSKPSKISLCTNRDDHLIPLLFNGDFVLKAQLTSLYMHPTDYSFRLYDTNQDFFTSIPSKIMGPYQYWLDNGVKIVSLQFNFLRPSIYDLKTDESDPSFLSISQKATHHKTYTKIQQYKKPQNNIFVNYKYTSLFTMTIMYTLDHSCITDYLRNYEPIKQNLCLLPYNNTSRPLIVPQEYLIHYDDFLLSCNIPTQIVKPLTVIHIFVNYKYTSPFTMTNMYTLDHSCITDYLRNYEPIKQNFCLLPYNNTSRPLIVPQEYLIHYDDFLLPSNIPTQIVKPLTVIHIFVKCKNTPPFTMTNMYTLDHSCITDYLRNHEPKTKLLFASVQ